MDGPWQLGHVPAGKYAQRALRAGRMMKAVDPSIELVACGSCGITLPTYMDWDLTVLDHLGDLADFISLHRYVGNAAGNTPDFLAVTNSIDRQIRDMDAACRYVQAKRGSEKRAYLSFDEWNVAYGDLQSDGQGAVAPSLAEQVYNLEDALVVAGFLNSFLRHADVVKIANLAQIVNVIAPILTCGDQVLIQPTYHAFEMFSKRREGTSLQVVLSGPSYVSDSHGRVPYVDSSAIVNGQRLHVFAVNRHVTDKAWLHVVVRDRHVRGCSSAETLTGPGAKAANSFSDPRTVIARPFDDCLVRGGTASVLLPPLSATAVTLETD
jgi:alpha-N-arabinofuranosidase